MVISVALGAVAVGLLGLEIALRWADGLPLTGGFGRHCNAFFSQNELVAYHPRLGWTLAPNLRLPGMTSDEHGNRLPSATPRALPVGAVLACGDSFTAGSEVVDSESWPALLEQRIGAPVINAAGGGWGADQIAMRAEEFLVAARPRVLIVSFFRDDMERAELGAWDLARKPYYVIRDGALELRGVPVPLVSTGRAEAIVGRCYLAFLVARRLGYVGRGRPPERTAPVGAGVEIARRLLERLKVAMDQAGGRMLFLVQYGHPDVGGALNAHEAELVKQAKAIAALARDSGIETIDPWERLSALHERDMLAYQALFIKHPDGGYGHMSKAGNQLIADMVADALLGQA